jgi:type I restriction enzyme S subunit
MTRLGDVLEVQNGFAFSSKNFSPDAPIGLIRIRDLRNGHVTETGYRGQYDNDYVVNAGDLLIGMDGEFRCYEWKGKAALLNQRVCRLRNFQKQLEPRYLFFCINKYLEAIEADTGFTTVKHLSSKTISNIEIPLPPLAEQKRIVARLEQILGETAELASRYEQARNHAIDLFMSALHAAFDGLGASPVKTLGEVCEIRNGATPDTGDARNWGGPHAWITPAEMSNLDSPVVGTTRRTLSDLGLSSCSASLAPVNSVILSSRAPIGHLVINAVPMATNQGCKTLVPEGSLDHRYLYYFLRANVAFLDSLGTGATFKELSAGKLRDVEIPVPLLAEQRRIVARLEGIQALYRDLEANATRRLSVAADLRQSVLEAAFRGEL